MSIDPKHPPAEVVLDEADTFSGQVLSESGDPIPGAIVRITPSAAEGYVVSDNAGLFSVPLADYPVGAVDVRKPGYARVQITYYKESQKCSDASTRK